MDPLKIHSKRRPEAILQESIELMLRHKGWYVKSTHGSIYQSGFPDLYTGHKLHGTRWIEVKVEESYSFTDAQLKNFPEMSRFGIGIWILVRSTMDEYIKLFQPPNWYSYLNILKSTKRLSQ